MAQGKHPQRHHLAYLAARILAQDGSLDFAQAKRKAAKQAGITNPQHLPDNREIEEALRSWQSLYQQDELPKRRLLMRQIALQIMHHWEEFNPYLVGSVLTGYPGPHSDINLQLFTDQQKSFELLLLNQVTDFSSCTQNIKLGDRLWHSLVFSFGYQNQYINALLLPVMAERINPKTQDGRVVERARSVQLQALIDQDLLSISAA